MKAKFSCELSSVTNWDLLTHNVNDRVQYCGFFPSSFMTHFASHWDLIGKILSTTVLQKEKFNLILIWACVKGSNTHWAIKLWKTLWRPENCNSLWFAFLYQPKLSDIFQKIILAVFYSEFASYKNDPNGPIDLLLVAIFQIPSFVPPLTLWNAFLSDTFCLLYKCNTGI